MILWIIIAVLLLVSFIFSGVEAGILSINRVQLRNRAKHKDRPALRLQKLLKEPERLLLTVVIVTNMANIFAITLATMCFVQHWGGIGYAVAFLFFLPIYLFGLELFPKAVFRRFPTAALAFLSTPLRFAFIALGPVLRFSTRLSRWLLPPAESKKLFAAREDFKYLTLETERSGAITPVERQLIHGVVDFRSVKAQDLMQPVTDFPTIPHNAEIEALIAASNKGRVERFLAISESGEILGLVSLFEAVLARGPKAKVSSHIRSIASVRGSESAFRVLRKMRTSRTQAALVMDGTTPRGLIFAETLYRRLVSG